MKDISKQIEDIERRFKAEIAVLKTQAKQCCEWEIKRGKWCIDPYGDVIKDTHCSQKQRNFGNTFQTKEDSIKYRDDIHRFNILWHLANDLNDGWEPDWSDLNQDKYFVTYNHEINEFVVVESYCYNYIVPVFKDQETAQKACDILNNQDLIKL